MGFVSISTVGLLVAMFLADGFRATSYDLKDASVWATRAQDGLVGRVNTQVAAQDAALRTGVPAPDVAQDGRSVFVVDRAGMQLIPVDVAGLALVDPAVPLPAEASVEVAKGTLVVSTDSGSVWIGETDSAASIAADERDPDLELGDGGAVTLGRGGQVVAYSAEDSELTVLEGGERSAQPVEASGPVQVSMSGERPVLLDQGAGQLVVPGGSVDLSKWGDDPQLQLSSDDDGQVLVATESGLLSVPTGDGEPTWVEQVTNSAPTRPVRMAGCSYSAWGGQPTEVVACDGSATINEPLEGASSGQLRFRLNRNHVILNELESGSVYFVVDGELRKVDKWEDNLPENDPEEEEEDDPDRSQVLDFSEENKPPVAEPDEFGARPGRSAVLTVLDNDVDPNGDVLVITEIDAPAELDVRIIGQGQSVQVQPPAGATGPYSFSYTITDGRGGSDSAQVELSITPDGQNSAPRQKAGARARFKVESGKSASYDVLQDWMDPDGDPIFLAGATVAGTPDTVQTLPSGVLTFTDSGVGTGMKEVEVTVSDAPPAAATHPESATGGVQVQVEPPLARIAPVARPDYRSTVIGSTVVIAPLENDSDGNGDELHVARLVLPDGFPTTTTSVVLAAVDDTITFRASQAGSYVFGYEVTDGVDLVSGLIRVDVLEASENRPPSAGRDLVVLPVQAHALRTVDLLANDVDLDGDVLVVQSIEVRAGAPITAQLLEHRRLRVSTSAQLAAPETIRYVVSDGQAESIGEVIVVSTPASSRNEPPVLGADAVTVRTGDVVNIAVLGNDVDPEGDDLTILPELAVAPGEGQGLAFVSGSSVRFVAPDRPTTVRMAYTVLDAGLNQPTGQIVVTVRSGDDNSAPVARTLEARVLAGNSVKVTVPLAGVDPDGDSVTFEGIGTDAPRLGRVVTPVGNDSIVYEAFPSARGGTDLFTYRIVDRRGATAEGVVRVGVAPRPERNGVPQPLTDRVEVHPGASVLVPVLTNDYDPDGDLLDFGDPAIDHVPEGLRAEVDEANPSKIRIVAPDEVRQIQPLIYSVTDGRSTAFGTVEVVVSDDAVGLPPVARDDEALAPNDADTTTVQVDVTENDDDPDGSIDELEVDLVGAATGASVSGRSLVVDLGPTPRLVVYRITDPQGLSATAIARIPAAGSDVDRAPVQTQGGPAVEAIDGQTTTIKVSDHVEDPEGRPVRLTTGARVSATHSDGTALVKDDPTTLYFTPEPGYTGPASITFEVTDGDAADTGNTVVVSLPIAVRSDKNTPPTFQGGISLTVAPNEEGQTVDLPPLVDDPDPGDRENLRFAIADQSSLPAGVTVELVEGARLRAVAAADAVPETAGSVMLTVADGSNEPTRAKVDVRVVHSSRPLPTCTQAVIEDANAGEAVSRDVIADCFNPFPDEPLGLTNATADAGSGRARIDGDSVGFTPGEDFVGSAVVRYQVTDAVGRTADGIISVNVRAVPDKPSPPTVVEVSSRQVMLTWQPPAPNGATIEYYEVRSSDGTTECAATTCTIDGLKNDTRYRFSVRAHNEVGDGEWSDESAEARPDQRPEPPTEVRLEFDEELPDGRLTASWAAARTEGSPITNYEIQISPPPDSGSGAIQKLGPVTSYTWTGLTNGTPYRVRVRAINSAQTGPSEWSQESNPEVPAKAPERPVITSVQRVPDPLGELIEVTWTAPEANGDEISGYRLDAFREGSSTPAKTINDIEGTAVSQVVDVDDYDNPYEFVLTATNKAGDSEPSLRSQPVQAERAPDPISTVTAAVSTGSTGMDRRATVSFSAPNDGGIPLTRYEVQINGGSIREFTTNLTASNPTLTVDGLTNGDDYRFAVRACNATLCQDAFSPATGEVRPYGPVGTPAVSANRASADAVRFDWSPPSANGRPVTGVQISINNGGWENVAVSSGRTVGNGRNQTYSIRVRALDEAGQTGPIATASRTTDPPPPPPAPVIRGSLSGPMGTGQSCDSSWRWITATFSNFTPGSTIQVRAYQTRGDVGDHGYQWPVRIDATGNGSLGNGYFCIGHNATSYLFVPGTSYRSDDVST